MARWEAVLPRRVMLNVNYEDVVADLESGPDIARGENASATQVRQAIYRHALGRWRPCRRRHHLTRCVRSFVPGAGPADATYRIKSRMSSEQP